MKKNHIVIFTGLTLTILNLIANESIEDSIIEFNSNPELYPPFKVSLIVFLNNKISTESKKEQFLDLERFIYKTELIKSKIFSSVLLLCIAMFLPFVARWFRGAGIDPCWLSLMLLPTGIKSLNGWTLSPMKCFAGPGA